MARSWAGLSSRWPPGEHRIHRYSQPLNIRELLDGGQARLASSPDARLDCEILLCHALSANRAFLYANADLEVPGDRARQFMELVERRSAGEPVAYLTGRRAFWTLDLHVTPEVLIPRPETERLVEVALELLPPGERRRVADVGTGSGAIALAIASERPECEVFATDTSRGALRLARENAELNRIAGVRFIQASWLSGLRGQFDLVVSNPPYVAQHDPHLRQGDCRFEPMAALSPGPDGLAAFRQIAAQAAPKLRAGGWLLFEHGHDQGAAVRGILEQEGLGNVRSETDLAGHQRVSLGQWRGPAAGRAWTCA